MVEATHHRLSITAQCHLLRISRSSYSYAPVPETDEALAIERSNHVWCADMTYIPMRRGFLYLMIKQSA
ncbi:hypothetical protein HT578_11775 [Novosphingobium decolorationis]|uniref:Transposase n=1 Tax=Novosphingobium decolorationis TaxID=2698673 RepID=A0ABX8E5N7_9SPHN|nr:hypothetical protein HT578_11775 [Novosphingobium decolorationis]